VRLLLLHPELAQRDCSVCVRYRHDAQGLVTLPNGQPIRRFAADPPACRKGGCPKGTPENPRTLSPDNELCYNHYRRCRATGLWPNDPLVLYHARILSEIEQGCFSAQLNASWQPPIGG
jgi:hypothetical protein